MSDLISHEEPGWRDDLLNRLRLIVLPVSILSGLFGTALAQTDATRWLGVVIAASCSAVVFLTGPRRPYRARAWWMISTVVVVSGASLVVVGLNPGPVLAVTFYLIMAAILLGRGVMTGLLVSMSALVVALGGAIALGLWSGPPMLEVDQRDPTIWMRLAFMSVIAWGGIAFSVVFVVNAVERTSRFRKTALEEKDEALQRLEAESRARGEAEAIASQAQKREALGQFAAGVAHDFNNVLLVVKAWTEILSDAPSKEHTEHGLRAIGEATAQAEQLARQLLTFGRKEVRAPR
jgi:signal transduction histidine kinase